MSTQDPFSGEAVEPLEGPTSIDGEQVEEKKVGSKARSRYHVFQAMPLEGRVVWVRLTDPETPLEEAEALEAPSKKAAIRSAAKTEDREQYMVIKDAEIFATPYGKQSTTQVQESWD